MSISLHRRATLSLLMAFIAFFISSCTWSPEVEDERAGASTQILGEPCSALKLPNAEPCRTCMPSDLAFTLPDIGDDDMLAKDPGDVAGSNLDAGQEYGPLGFVLKYIQFKLSVGTAGIFEALIHDEGYQKVVKAALTLMFVLFASSVALGIMPATPYQIILMVVKGSLIFKLVTDYDFFVYLIQDIVENFLNAIIAVLSETFSGVEVGANAADAGAAQVAQIDAFAPVDRVFSMFLNIKFVKFFLALLATKPDGLMYALYCLIMIGFYAFAVLSIAYAVIIAMIFRYLVYAIAPIFFIFAMFNQTKSLMTGWFRQLLNFTIQPIMLFAFLGLFHIILFGFLHGMIDDNMEVCYIKLFGFEGTRMSLYYWGFSTDSGLNKINELPINHYIMFIFLFMILLMYLTRDFAISVAAHISSGLISLTGTPVYGMAAATARITRPAQAAIGGARGAVAGAYTGTGVVAGMTAGAAQEWKRTGKTIKRLDKNIFKEVRGES